MIRLLLLVALSGCGDEPDPTCEISGSYTLSFFETAGDCGPQEPHALEVEDGRFRSSADPLVFSGLLAHASRCTFDLVVEDQLAADRTLTAPPSTTPFPPLIWSWCVRSWEGQLVVDDHPNASGTMSLQATHWYTGAVLCESDYDVINTFDNNR